MKKLSYLVLLLVCFAAISFTSCKKDYNCTCRTYVNGVQIDERDYLFQNTSKSDAESRCDSYIDVVNGNGTECTLN